MLGAADISATHWIVFVAAVLVFLALDLGVFHRKAHVVRFGEALLWTAIWFVTAMAFGLLVAPAIFPDWQSQQTYEFVTGYIIELSLSMDNVFVIALIFAYFRLPERYQHRVLFWGILGALLMRGFMIGAGVVLIQRDTGGNLAEILDNLAHVVRERFKIHRQIRVHTAHGRFTGYVLMALPAALAVALNFINPEHMQLLFHEHMGQMMLIGAIVMQAIGYVWIRQVIKIEV